MKFRAIVTPVTGNQADQMHTASRYVVENWAAWKLAKDPSKKIYIFESAEIQLGTITAETVCDSCSHPAKSHLGTNEGKTRCTGTENCGCRGFRSGGGAVVTTAMP